MNRIIKGDKVRVISGKNKSKEGIVVAVYPKDKTALVEGLNKIKVHQKASAQSNEPGKIVEKEAPIALCKLALVVDKAVGGTSKVAFIKKGDDKVRVAKKTQKELNKSAKK
ncbi:MAG: 50S ribosomal protein L24 [Mycoplasmataceae bacterium]|jgi:large subunit ribosomal protein L24|nr:50S ribosomal protein L24 [Mycoplasmataceae bacterium]